MARTKHTLSLTTREMTLVLEALDSHIYWQLSDPHYRHSGDVWPPGSDDSTNARAIAQTERLLDRLRRAAPA